MGNELRAICVSDLLGALLCVTMIIGIHWRQQEEDKENRYIRNILACVLTSCLADVTVSLLEGFPGMITAIVMYICCVWLFAADLICSLMWLHVVYVHMGVQMSRRKAFLMQMIAAGGFAVLLINLVYPCVFTIGEGNTYMRGPLYYLYIAIAGIYLINTVSTYLRIRRQAGQLKFFPLWLYVVPLTIGIVVQSLVPHVSLMWPSAALSIAGLLISLQNEQIFKDKLTGLYNRYYLDQIYEQLAQKENSRIAVLMMDVNQFKWINDNLGHNIGDAALKALAQILQGIVSGSGIVVRYAGDEFVVLLNTDDLRRAEQCREQLTRELESFNQERNRGYQLSVSVGIYIASPNSERMEEIMHYVDGLMYHDKQEYYRKNNRKDRRRA